MNKHIIESLLQPGDLILTTHANAELNTTPGRWNHTIIYVGGGECLEATRQYSSTVMTMLKDVLDRDLGELCIMRITSDEVTQNRIVKEAWKRNGLPYRMLHSFTRMRRRGANCVSLANMAANKAMGVRYDWNLPDDIYADKSLELILEDTNHNN